MSETRVIDETALWGTKTKSPCIRWNDRAEVFFVDYGTIHMALTKSAASILARALDEAIANLL